AVAVSDHIARSPIPRKCLRDLTGNPFRRWILCDVDPDEVSAVDPNDDECIEEVKTDRRDDEEVHGGNLRRVVEQEGSPFLPAWFAAFPLVLGRTGLRDLTAEREQLAVDARRAPKWIVDAAPPDQRAPRGVALRSASRGSRLPPPVAANPRPV